MTNGGPPPIESVEAHPAGQPVQPHRGVMILVFGILGLVCCFIFGIIAWVMGNADLQEMDAGRMDPTGRGLTQAGKILGIISVALAILGIVIWLLSAMVGGGMRAMQM